VAEKTLQCPFCPDKAYSSQYYYDKHMARKHPPVEGSKEAEPVVEVPEKPKGPERREYVCVTPCWHNGTLYKKGRTAWFAGNYPKDPDGNLRHFEPLDPGAPRPVMEEPLVTVTPE
jgi:hypothetical protein